MITQRGTRRTGPGAVLLAGCTALVLLAGCTGDPGSRPPGELPLPAGGLQLVAFDSCADALTDLRSAAKAYVGPWGFGDGGGIRTFEGAGGAPADAGGSRRAVAEKAAPDGAQAGGGPGHSGTNTHEAGVDEPDLVKTDGRRIVTVTGGALRVIDPVSRRVTGTVHLDPDAYVRRWLAGSLLLHGDRALVLVPQEQLGIRRAVDKRGRPGAVPPVDDPDAVVGPRLVLVDLAGPPRILAEYRIDGSLIDARQVGGTVRIVVRSAPRLDFPQSTDGSDAERTTANRQVIDRAGVEAWLPRYETTVDGQTTRGQVDCDRLTRPATYSGSSLVTVLTFDLAASAAPGGAGAPAGSVLGDGDPVTVVADGDTVYSNGHHLYIANDQQWRVLPATVRGDDEPDPQDQATDIYQFDIDGPGRPRYLTAASVPGWLINQYAMSEWNGHLRVATTVGRTWGDHPDSSSTVHVLRADGRTLTETGKVTGLGRGERIYAVRFAAGIGYVVTFRETDPLYTLDLSDPAAPKVAGELKITGYSAYLHPIGDGRLLGIGQEASQQGRRQGTQVSLFDVSDLARPTRLAQHHVANGQSEAEFDPHAFLYWPASGLVVVPLTRYATVTPRDGRPIAPKAPRSGALALRVGDGSLSEAGSIDHREVTVDGEPVTIRRSLVVDGVLWTISDQAAKATDLGSLRTLGLLRFG